MSQQAKSEFDTVRDDLTKLSDDIANLAASLKEGATDAAREQLAAARDRFERLTDEARTRGEEHLENLAATIEERPLTSVLIAFGVGIVLGRLFDR
ncbi:DUF883 family protein [Roseiterribacter gracilis]|uniref:DUF883 domain-containing protein n=1 Tax=Roseiterribacter gracilis TaxID=2812848 RepID=A0A8S8X8H5_9PROT|nr:hypothetical protein TMPK1_20000 [Rhodospirillales bacterium TMPK1]